MEPSAIEVADVSFSRPGRSKPGTNPKLAEIMA
jgi:hypothetical protein